VSFAAEADAFQDTLRRRVVRVNERLDTRESCIRQRPARKERDCTRGQRRTTTPSASSELASAIASDSPSPLSARPHWRSIHARPSATVKLAGTVVPSGMRGSQLASSTQPMSLSVQRRSRTAPSVSGGSG
jgi:hypothetical protein